MNLCRDWEIPLFSWVVFRITGYDMNSQSDNYCYYGLFYYNGINNIQFISLQKIAGTASITATNAQGTIASTFDTGAPSLNLEVINYF